MDTIHNQFKFDMDKALTATNRHNSYNLRSNPEPPPAKCRKISVEWTRSEIQSFYKQQHIPRQWGKARKAEALKTKFADSKFKNASVQDLVKT